jgi:hypothetical protein
MRRMGTTCASTCKGCARRLERDAAQPVHITEIGVGYRVAEVVAECGQQRS